MEQKLKQLPAEPKKGKIFEMYGKQYSTKVIRQNLNAIIDDFKNRTKGNVSYRQVPRPVWIEWLKIYGFPVNYEPMESWLSEKTIFDKE